MACYFKAPNGPTKCSEAARNLCLRRSILITAIEILKFLQRQNFSKSAALAD